MPADTALRRVVRLVALLNLGYFGVEFAVALAIGSVALFADSIDFLEDASVNFLILAALGWRAVYRARVGMASRAFCWSLASRPSGRHGKSSPCLCRRTLYRSRSPVRVRFAINLVCAFMLTRYRAYRGSLTRAAFLSARNDALANIAIIVAGLVTASLWPSAWPDLIVGLGIAAMNADAAREVWTAAREEHRAAKA